MANPYFRYETTKQEFAGLSSQDYSHDLSEQYYAFNAHPKYVTINRDLQRTNVRLVSSLMKAKSAESNRYETFWSNTQLGECDFTYIDQEKRMLFDCSWLKKYGPLMWTRRNGGQLAWNIELHSPYPWTPPFHAFYPVLEIASGTDPVDHTINTDNQLTEGDGSLVQNGGDSNVLRLNGYAMKLEDGATQPGYYNDSISWTSKKDNPGITLFVQCRVPIMADGVTVTIAEINDGSDSFGIYIEKTASGYEVLFQYTTGGVTANVTKSGGDNAVISANTWYDLCLSYDGVNDNVFAYRWNSGSVADETVWEDFLEGTTTSDAVLLNTIVSSPTVYPADTTWTDFEVLEIN